MILKRFKSLFSNGYVLAHGFTFIASVAISLIAITIFEPSDYIEFMTAYAVMNFLIPIITMASPSYIIRSVRTGERIESICLDVILMFILGTMAGSLLLYIYLKVTDIQYVSLAWLLGASVLLAALTAAAGVYRAQSQPRLYLVSVAGSKILLAAFLLIFVLLGFNLGAAEILSISIVLSSVVALCLLRFRVIPAGGWQVNENWRPIFFSVPLVLANLIVLFYPFYERTLLGSLNDTVQVGMYIFIFDIALKGAGGYLIFMKILAFPKVMSLDVMDGEIFIRKTRLMLLVIAVVGTLLSISIASYPDIERYLKGLSSRDFLLYSIMAIGCGCLAIMSYTSVIKLVRIGVTYPVAMAGGCAVSVYILLLPSMVSGYGVKGAGGAMLLAGLINAVVLELFYITGRRNEKYRAAVNSDTKASVQGAHYNDEGPGG